MMEEIHGKPFEEYKAIDFIFASGSVGCAEMSEAFFVINVS